MRRVPFLATLLLLGACNPEALTGLGDLLAAEGKLDEAIEHYEAAVRVAASAAMPQG